MEQQVSRFLLKCENHHFLENPLRVSVEKWAETVLSCAIFSHILKRRGFVEKKCSDFLWLFKKAYRLRESSLSLSKNRSKSPRCSLKKGFCENLRESAIRRYTWSERVHRENKTSHPPNIPWIFGASQNIAYSDISHLKKTDFQAFAWKPNWIAAKNAVSIQ